MGLFQPTYFSPISQYAVLWNMSEILFECQDNYQKQSYRNRCYVSGPNGKQTLSVPVSFDQREGRKKTKDAKIDYSESWQKEHLKTLETCYNASPFFDLLRSDLERIIHRRFEFLLDLNIATFLFVKDVLQLDVNYSMTKEYYENNSQDYRFLADAKKSHNMTQLPYHQMFSEKFSFQTNLSILDLLFMEGSNAISFLEKNHVTLNNPRT